MAIPVHEIDVGMSIHRASLEMVTSIVREMCMTTVFTAVIQITYAVDHIIKLWSIGPTGRLGLSSSV